MFDFDPGKLLVFGIVALAVIPPKDLPRVLRTVGKYVGQMRRMAADFQGQFADAIKEVELESVKKEIAEINKAAKVDVSFDPAGMMRDSVHKSIDAPTPVKELAPIHDVATLESPLLVEPPALAAPAASSEPEKTPARPT